MSDNAEPNTTTSPSFLAGDDKRALLAGTGVLVNIHQSDEPYFEWLRFADAVHCGTPVLSEASTGTAPFRPGEHFVEFAPGTLADALRSLPSQERLDAMAAAALDVLRDRPLSEGVTPLLEAAIRIVATTKPPKRLAPRSRTEPLGRDRTDPTPVPGWPTRKARLRTVVTKLAGVGPRVVSPDLVAWRGTPPRVPRDAGFVSVIVDGCDADGRPSLEGLWPWEPWRLRHGQHLGRVLLVDNVVASTAEQWCTEPWAAAHPHVVIQLFCAVHGIRGNWVMITGRTGSSW